MGITHPRSLLLLALLVITGSLGVGVAQAQTAACPSQCDGSATIVRHGGDTDRYWQLEAQPNGSTYSWQCLDCPEDPFTPFDGLDQPDGHSTKVNRMFERTYMVTVDPGGGSEACACADVTPYEGSFSFMAIADPQFGVLQPKQHPFLLEARQLDRAIDLANRQQVAFVAVLGDMVNLRANADQLATYAERMARLDRSIPRIEVPGNHDVANMPTVATLADYRDRRGDDFFSFSYAGSRFFVINSTLLDIRRFMSTPYWETDGKAVDEDNEQHRTWLQAELSPQPGDRHRIVLSHHPFS